MPQQQYDDGSQQLELDFGLEPVPTPEEPHYPGGIPSEAELRQRLADAISLNQEKYQTLLQMRRKPDPTAILSIRINTILDLIFTPSERLHFDVIFESRVSALFDQLLSRAAKDAIMEGVNSPHVPPPGGLIVPG